jgi:hypothetical protein
MLLMIFSVRPSNAITWRRSCAIATPMAELCLASAGGCGIADWLGVGGAFCRIGVTGVGGALLRTGDFLGNVGGRLLLELAAALALP